MDHYFDSHSVLLLWERLERKRLRQWLRLQQRLRRLLLTEVPKQIESMHGRRALREGRAPLLSACAAGQLEVSEWNSMQSPKRMIAFL